MFLQIVDNRILINNYEKELKGYHINQLLFWGFSKNQKEQSLELAIENDANLIKVVNYFEKEAISFKLSSPALDIINNETARLKEFGRLKQLGKEFKETKINNKNFEEFVQFTLKSIPRKLKEHQLKAAYHLYLLNSSANFSVPGSGKTSVVLSVYEKLRLEKKVNVLFVVGPPSCFGPWRSEFKSTLGRNAKSQVLAGGNPTVRKSSYFTSKNSISEVYFITFQTLLQDIDDLATFLSNKDINPYLVIDEAHYMKRVEGNWANAVLKIAKFTKYKCILTGTPFPRSYTDVFNFYEFLWPKEKPINDETKIRIKNYEIRNDHHNAKKAILTSIGPLFYRVKKSDLGLRPAIFNEPILIDMNKNERFIYDSIERKIRNLNDEDYLKNLEIVSELRRGRIIRLRQTVSYIKLLTTAIQGYEENLIDESGVQSVVKNYDKLEKPAKLEYLLKFLQPIHNNNQKVVIWSNFIGTIELLHKTLTEANLYNKVIYGKTPIEQTAITEEETREKIRNEFVSTTSGLDILIANPAACSESISLHKTCHKAIYYDLSYNCAQYLQSLDRIHRVGGSEKVDVNYYFLQYKNTIDSDILQNVRSKANRMYSIIEDGTDIYSLDMFADETIDEVDAYNRVFNKR